MRDIKGIVQDIRAVLDQYPDDKRHIYLDSVRECTPEELQTVTKKGHPTRCYCAQLAIRIMLADGCGYVRRDVFFDGHMVGREGFVFRCKETLRRHAKDNETEQGRGFIFTKRDKKESAVMLTLDQSVLDSLTLAVDQDLIAECNAMGRDSSVAPDSAQPESSLSKAIASVRAMRLKKVAEWQSQFGAVA